jgi:TrmH family RNA methyltransferase
MVRAFRALARGAGPAGEILLDGAHLVREALAAGVPLRAVLASADFLARAGGSDRAVIDAAVRAGAVVHEVSGAVLDAASPVRTSSGIVASAMWAPADAARTFAPAPALVVGLVDVQDPGNVGSAIRSADALGATGVIAVGDSAHPGGWKALRGAMGSTFHLPVARASQDAAVGLARRANARVIATAAGAADAVDAVDFNQPTLVLVGNEGAGLSADLLAQADQRVAIPMRPAIESLNVSATVAIVLYEARRQRQLA